MITAIETIFRAYDEGRPAHLVTGRSLYDLIIDTDGKMRPLLEALRIACQSRGLHVVRYSMADGLDWDAGRLHDDRDRRSIEQALRSHLS